MYPITQRFQMEINKASRLFSWSGTIRLRDGDILHFTDKDILKGTGYIHRACSGSTEIEIGSIYASEFGLSLYSDINRYRLEKAQLSLTYHLHYSDEVKESIPMGVFEVTEANRSKKRIELKGYDFMLRFDRSLSVTDIYGTAYELLQFACVKCGVLLGVSEDDIKILPNGEELLGVYHDHDIETYRDLIHYIASTLGTFAMINRHGQLILKAYGQEPVAEIQASQRFTSSISDFKTFYTAINSTNAKTKMAEYYALEGDDGLTMNLGINPLLQLGLKEKRQRMCQQLLEAVSQISYTPFEATTIGNPSLDPGDMISQIVEGEAIQGLITNIEYKINGKHRISGVGKNPYFGRVKSKHDKNLIGILNQIESEHLVIHSFTNIKEFSLTKEDSPIIKIEFASNKESEALFNGSILLDVECDTQEVVHTVQPKANLNLTQTETEEPLPLYEWSEMVQVPTRVIVTYVFNDQRVEEYVPTETYLNGRHVLNLFYPLINLQEKSMNTFTVLMRLETGQVFIDKNHALASISGQSLGSTESWDGKLTVADWWQEIPLNRVSLFSGFLKESVSVQKGTPVQNSFNYEINRFRYKGISLRGFLEQSTTQVNENLE
ncbi:hypothetical protein [Facklamia lactis]|uniref:hypothetical protein n=1 Tax=Facklamia lactis TaxID=2749967 RepID=UPI0018CFE5F9|nr:hypothetical protein [Facklamia lactis]MBG9980437.1 hypothetical protein [Facklamia lactis]